MLFKGYFSLALQLFGGVFFISRKPLIYVCWLFAIVLYGRGSLCSIPNHFMGRIPSLKAFLQFQHLAGRGGKNDVLSLFCQSFISPFSFQCLFFIPYSPAETLLV